MSKDASLRLAETLGCVPELAGGALGSDIHAAMTDWVAQQADQNALSAEIALGGWHPFANATDKALRCARRAVLLAHRYSGGVTARHKAQVERMTLAELGAELRRLFGALPPAPNNGFASFASSFDFATAAEKDIVRLATAEVGPRLAAAVSALSRARADMAEQARFATWFGPYSDLKLAKVLKNFNTLAANRKGYHYYYRGASLPRGYMEVMFPGDEPVAQYKSKDVASYAADPRRDADPLRVHLFIGSGGLLDGTVGQRGSVANPGARASRASVLVHELSHFLCRTNDEPAVGGDGGRMYGSRLCRERAAANDPKVLTNASNYQWYAEEFS